MSHRPSYPIQPIETHPSGEEKRLTLPASRHGFSVYVITDQAKIERSCVASHGRQLNENVIVIPWKVVLVSTQPIPI